MWFRGGWEPASLRQPEWPATPRPAVSGQTAVGLRPPGRPRIAVGTWFSPFGVFSHELRWGRPPGLPIGVQLQRMNPHMRTVWLLAFIASLAVLSFGVWFQVSLAQNWTRPAMLPYGVNRSEEHTSELQSLRHL